MFSSFYVRMKLRVLLSDKNMEDNWKQSDRQEYLDTRKWNEWDIVKIA
jgi:hypothetical protein